MQKALPFLLVAFLLVSSGCYHTMVTTGAAPGTQVVDIPWASSWVYGLVPPKTVEAAAECPNGVAVVESQISFVNGLVAALTFSIYTPMHITVTCAAGGMATDANPSPEITVVESGSGDEVIETFKLAAEKAAREGVPVRVRFE